MHGPDGTVAFIIFVLLAVYWERLSPRLQSSPASTFGSLGNIFVFFGVFLTEKCKAPVGCGSVVTTSRLMFQTSHDFSQRERGLIFRLDGSTGMQQPPCAPLTTNRQLLVHHVSSPLCGLWTFQKEQNSRDDGLPSENTHTHTHARGIPKCL